MFNPESGPAETTNPNENEPNTPEFEAKTIAKNGDFDLIKQELEEQGLLGEQVKRVQEEYKSYLENINFLNESDLEMLTILELYDKNLAFHSLETYDLAKDKSERQLDFGIVLIDVFATENVTPEQFFRACLLHDVGKVYVPNFILNNEVDINEMSNLMLDLVKEQDKETIDNINRLTGESKDSYDLETLDTLLKKHHLRPAHIVPVKHLLNEEQLAITENTYHLSPDLSLMDIIKMHENHSGEILEQAGYDIESDLAGSHHNYHGRGSSHQRTLEALQLSVDTVELLRMADITHALGDSRPYNKTGFSKPKIWKIILEEVEAGKISEVMAYLWLNDEIKMHEQDLTNSEDTTDEDRTNIEFVKDKLQALQNDLDFKKDVENFLFPRAA